MLPHQSSPSTFQMPALPSKVTVVEVGLRDGLQSEKTWIETKDKIGILNDLVACGIPQFEATSFVSPRAVPQLKDGAEVLAGADRRDGVRMTALVPNPRGARAAVSAGVDTLVLFVSASESHNRKNMNATRAETLAGFAEICAIAKEAEVGVRGGIATSFGCPFEGEIAEEAVCELAHAYRALGIRQITLGDSTGMATPPLVLARCAVLKSTIPDIEISLHFHNTRGLGLANVFAGLLAGVTTFESSLGGLGGCPFAPGATGNICTEDLVYLLHELGIETGIDFDRLCAVSQKFEKLIGRTLPGQVMKAGPRLKTSPLDAAPTATG